MCLCRERKEIQRRQLLGLGTHREMMPKVHCDTGLGGWQLAMGHLELCISPTASHHVSYIYYSFISI